MSCGEKRPGEHETSAGRMSLPVFYRGQGRARRRNRWNRRQGTVGGQGCLPSDSARRMRWARSADSGDGAAPRFAMVSIDLTIAREARIRGRTPNPTPTWRWRVLLLLSSAAAQFGISVGRTPNKPCFALQCRAQHMRLMTSDCCSQPRYLHLRRSEYSAALKFCSDHARSIDPRIPGGRQSLSWLGPTYGLNRTEDAVLGVEARSPPVR